MSSFFDRLFGKKKQVIETKDNTIVDIDRMVEQKVKQLLKENGKQKEIVVVQPAEGEKVKFGDNTPNIVAELRIANDRYVLADFELTFMQDVVRNRPDSATYGGIISMTLIDKPNDNIEEWISDQTKRHNGEIRFYKNDVKEAGNSLINITFADAFCVEYQKKIDVSKGENYTVIKINPKSVKIGNEEFRSERKN